MFERSERVLALTDTDSGKYSQPAQPKTVRATNDRRDLRLFKNDGFLTSLLCTGALYHQE